MSKCAPLNHEHLYYEVYDKIPSIVLNMYEHTYITFNHYLFFNNLVFLGSYHLKPITSFSNKTKCVILLNILFKTWLDSRNKIFWLHYVYLIPKLLFSWNKTSEIKENNHDWRRIVQHNLLFHTIQDF